MALTVVYLIVGIAGGTLITPLIYGVAQPPAVMGNLPSWGAFYSLLIWPVLWGIVEELTYQGYALPRLQLLTGRSWLAVLLVTAAFGLQHIALPFTPDVRFMLWRFATSTLVGLVSALVYLRLRRLLPLVIAHWAANFLSVLTLVVLPIVQR